MVCDKIYARMNLVFVLLAAAVFFISFTSLSLIDGSIWATTRFPLHEPYSVFFTLDSLQGKTDATIATEAGKLIALNAVVAFAVAVGVFLFAKKYPARSKLIYTAACVCAGLLLFAAGAFAYKKLHFGAFLKVQKIMHSKPVHSDFYETEYIEPAGKVTFPEKKKNLIVIFLESFESSYQSEDAGGLFTETLIPQITQFAAEEHAVNFSANDALGGGSDVNGTNWTIAAMLSKFGGVPYSFTKAEMNALAGGKFLPHLTTLNDILAEGSYTQRFLFGTDKHFAARNLLLENHGNVEIHDLDYYSAKGLIADESKTFWGFDDAQLYECAKLELTELSKTRQPWFLGFLTLDLHMPYGFPSHDMEVKFTDAQNPKKAQMKNIVFDTDKKITAFLNWCKKQSWFDNTTIVMFGDHTFMNTSKTAFFDALDNTAARYWFDLFVNVPRNVVAEAPKIKQRQFASFDMLPTILAALDCKVEGERLGLGVNLFSGQQTLLERYDKNRLNEELMKKNTVYRTFLQK